MEDVLSGFCHQTWAKRIACFQQYSILYQVYLPTENVPNVNYPVLGIMFPGAPASAGDCLTLFPTWSRILAVFAVRSVLNPEVVPHEQSVDSRKRLRYLGR